MLLKDGPFHPSDGMTQSTSQTHNKSKHRKVSYQGANFERKHQV